MQHYSLFLHSAQENWPKLSRSMWFPHKGVSLNITYIPAHAAHSQGQGVLEMN